MGNAWDKLQLRNKGVFPVICMHPDQVINVIFERRYFKQPMCIPSGYHEILFPDKDNMLALPIPKEHHKEITEAAYAVVCNEKEKVKQEIYKDFGIYRFDKIQDVAFIIPQFIKPLNCVSIYVKPTGNEKWVLIKSFEISKIRKTVADTPQNRIDYVLKALEKWNRDIRDPKNFWRKIGFEWDKSWDLTKNFDRKRLFKKTATGKEVVRRMVEELGLPDLECTHRLFTSKFVLKVYNEFNYISMKIKVNDYDPSGINDNTITDIKCFHKAIYKFEDETKENQHNKDYKYNDEIIIRNISKIEKLSYKIKVNKPQLLGFEPVLLQHINEEIHYDELDDSFRKNLKKQNDGSVKLINVQGNFGKVHVSQTTKGFRIESKSTKPTIMGNCELTTGKYYFEIEIVRLMREAEVGDVVDEESLRAYAAKVGRTYAEVAKAYVRERTIIKFGYASIEHGPTESMGLFFFHIFLVFVFV